MALVAVVCLVVLRMLARAGPAAGASSARVSAAGA
jgi:hypothetical protein